MDTGYNFEPIQPQSKKNNCDERLKGKSLLRLSTTRCVDKGTTVGISLS